MTTAGPSEEVNAAGLGARRCARELLRVVREDDGYANVVMPGFLHEFGLSSRDAAFAVELGYGTLRMQGFLDEVVKLNVTRSWDRVQDDMKDLLRLGAYQLLFMRVPDHAAIHTTCELARRRAGDDSRVGFINAVLRGVSKKSLKEWQSEVRASAGSPDGASQSHHVLAAIHSHPTWIVDALSEALGDDGSLERLLEADNAAAAPTIAFVSRGGPSEADLKHLVPGRWSPRGAILTSGTPADLDAIVRGEAIVQDEGSQLIADALASAPVAPPESAWLDMCAGPGGKAAVLAEHAAERGVSFTAVELHEHRTQLMRKVLPDSVMVMTADARNRPWGNQFFDRVLLDAPCTGLGALRRRPEARWRKRDADLKELTRLQLELLGAALDSTRVGGLVGYATC
ncbi:MAG: hypothetical protein RJB01_195, partial [Actinomycetota bacterium]